jgi:hypothetical protein
MKPMMLALVLLVAVLGPACAQPEEVCRAKGGMCVRMTDAGCEIDKPVCCSETPRCFDSDGFSLVETGPTGCVQVEQRLDCL